MSVVVFGSVNLDMTVYVEALPRPGQTIHAGREKIGLGGKGANQAVAAQRLSAEPVRFVAATGEDAFGAMVRAELAAKGVPLARMQRFAAATTGIALIHVDAASQNTITVLGGANMAWPDTGPDPEVFEAARVALFQLETPLDATLSAMRAARASGVRVMLDPAPVPDCLPDEFLALSDVITPNETETEAMIGIRPEDGEAAVSAARALCCRGAGLAVIKLGARGLAYAAQDGAEGVIPPFRVQAIDTVAAGDVFNGALGVALAEGKPAGEALRFAAAAGALATTRRGASASAPSRAEVEAMLAG